MFTVWMTKALRDAGGVPKNFKLRKYKDIKKE